MRMKSAMMAGVLALAASTPGWAQSNPVLGQATGWLSNLSYHLVDLDPNDGVTPWVTFNQLGAYAGYYQPGGGQHIKLGDDVFAMPIGSVSSPSGELSSGGSGTAYTLASQLRAGTVQNLNGTGAQPYDWLYYNSNGVVSAYGSGLDDSGVPTPLLGDRAWTLSANTALVVDGVMQVNAEVDLSQLTQGTLVQAMVDGQYGVRLTMSAFTTLQLNAEGVDGPLSSSAEAFANGRQILDASGLSLDPDMAPSDSAHNAFSVRLDNASTQALSGHLFMGVGAMAIIDTTPIPEPGTFALMSLGLGLVGWRAARARHT